MKPREIVGTVIAAVLVVYVLVLSGVLFFGTPGGQAAQTTFDKLIGLLGPVVGFYFGLAPTATAQEQAAAAKAEVAKVKQQSAATLADARLALEKSAHVSGDPELKKALQSVKETISLLS